jgi:hypothetical protein
VQANVRYERTEEIEEMDLQAVQLIKDNTEARQMPDAH